MNKIVVGVDCSDGSRRALDWALDEAKLRGASVTAVHAWQVPQFLATPFGTMPMELHQVETAVQSEIAAVLDEAEAAHGTTMDRVVVAMTPAAALIEAGADADLVVVGTRGRGGFTGLLLGSVSQQVVQHAPCPVVIVP